MILQQQFKTSLRQRNLSRSLLLNWHLIAEMFGYGRATQTLQSRPETYIGGGQLLSISPIEETVEVAARGVNLALNGINSSLVSVALTESYQGRTAQVYFGVISSGAVVSDPYLVFDGRMDVMTIEDAGETASISLSAESRLIDLERARVRRFTDNDQQNQFSGDTSLRFVASLQDKEIAWGSGKDDNNFAVPSGFGQTPLA